MGVEGIRDLLGSSMFILLPIAELRNGRGNTVC